MMRRVRRGERGSAAVEVALLVPALGALVLLVVFGGRVALARQSVQTAATDAARAASIARTADDARTQATRIAQATLANQGLRCATTSVDVDTSGFNRPPGTPATATVTVTCEVLTADLALPLAGTVRIEQAMSSPLDTYRGRGK
jgi:Flp pilus assembly protein TadG